MIKVKRCHILLCFGLANLGGASQVLAFSIESKLSEAAAVAQTMVAIHIEGSAKRRAEETGERNKVNQLMADLWDSDLGKRMEAIQGLSKYAGVNYRVRDSLGLRIRLYTSSTPPQEWEAALKVLAESIKDPNPIGEELEALGRPLLVHPDPQLRTQSAQALAPFVKVLDKPTAREYLVQQLGVEKEEGVVAVILDALEPACDWEKVPDGLYGKAVAGGPGADRAKAILSVCGHS